MTNQYTNLIRDSISSIEKSVSERNLKNDSETEGNNKGDYNLPALPQYLSIKKRTLLYKIFSNNSKLNTGM